MVVCLHRIDLSGISTEFFNVFTFHIGTPKMRREPVTAAVRCELIIKAI